MKQDLEVKIFMRKTSERLE